MNMDMNVDVEMGVESFGGFRIAFRQTSHLIWVIGSPIILALGTMGNALAIVVLTRKRMRRISSAFLLTILAIFDTLMLYLGLLRHFIRELTGVDIRDNANGAWCKWHIFLLYYTRHMSSWVLVAVALERFVSVWFPFKAKTLCTHRNAAYGLICLALPLGMINTHFFWTFGPEYISVVDSNLTVLVPCTYVNKHRGFSHKIWPWIEVSLSTFAPFLLMLFCNTMIIARLLRARVQRKHQVTPFQSSRDGVRMTSMTGMLLTTTFTFILLTLPAALYLTGQISFWKQIRQRVFFRIFWVIAQLLIYLNNAINFILYCVSGPHFRREVLLLFRGKCRRIDDIRGQGQTQNIDISYVQHAPTGGPRKTFTTP